MKNKTAKHSPTAKQDAGDKTRYRPQTLEADIDRYWERQNCFDTQTDNQKEHYAIVLPPPNVTGSLHMGHGFQQVIMDTLIRYQRMCGKNALWQAGTDHAGIATQMVVENQLRAEGTTRREIGRSAFTKRVWQWKEQYGNRITKQMQRLGSSIDWRRARFTMDEGFDRAVRQTFVELYRQKLIYRGKRLVNWDPHFKTAISDLEVVNTETPGHLWHVRYPLADSTDSITVATTRPETMLGDTAVAVNPDDTRWQSLIGKQIALPLSERKIPIIADKYVDPDFGSGCVKITPAHDFNDYEIGKRHDLPMLNIFTEDGKLNDNVPQAYRGLERFAARDKVLADLQQQGLLIKTENHMLNIPRNDRGGNIVEPYLTDQWYVAAKKLAPAAIEAVKNGQTRFVPQNWEKIYFQWLENIDDWCISRQLWWGHRIPAWYDTQGQVYVGADEQDVRRHYGLAADVALYQDEDVLDTWFSASLWPFITLGYDGDDAAIFNAFYPTDVLVTGFDIIFFWVARMMMMSLHITGNVPFKEVYITGLIRDHEGHKMSKTKGNVLDPIDLIDGITLDKLLAKRTQGLMQESKKTSVERATRKQFPQGIEASGTDALRFTYLALAGTGRDIRFDVNRLQGYRNFCNKLWNAARYVLMNTEDLPQAPTVDPQAEHTLADRWILSRLQHTVRQAQQHFADYRFDLLAQLLHEFTWHQYCDWYLECAKITLNDTDDAERRGKTQNTLLLTLGALLRLLHPLIPFITEALWQQLAPHLNQADGSVMFASYPQQETRYLSPQAEHDMTQLQQIILAIRNMRGEANISPKQKLDALIYCLDDCTKDFIQRHQVLLMHLAKLNTPVFIDEKPPQQLCAHVPIAGTEIYLPLPKTNTNKQEEIRRLQKEMDKLQKDKVILDKKLDNPNFIAKAPPAVVAKDKARLQTIGQTLAKLRQQLQRQQS